MEQLRNIPKTSRCREDLHSGSATRVLPLRSGGKGALLSGGQQGLSAGASFYPHPEHCFQNDSKGNKVSLEEAPSASRLQPASSSYLRHQPFASQHGWPRPGYHSHRLGYSTPPSLGPISWSVK